MIVKTNEKAVVCDDAKTSSRSLFFLILLTIIGSAFVLFYLAIYANTPEVYKDIVIENIALFSSNKSVEIHLLYLLIFGGMLIYCIYYFFFATKKLSIESYINNDLSEEHKKLLPIISFFLCIYTINAVYRIYTFYGGEKIIGYVQVLLLAILPPACLLLLKNKEKILYRFILLEQLLIPFTLLIFFQSKYLYNNEVVTIGIPVSVKILILAIILFSVIEAISTLVKNWKQGKNIITCGTCISIIMLNNYVSGGVIMSPDLHHTFEHVIGYSQVVELGQKLFSQYIPVSGLYSIVYGVFFKFFGHGEFAYFNIATNVFALFIVIVTVFLLNKQLNRTYIFFVSLLFPVLYNRAFFLLPIMLLLLMPQVIQKRTLWIQLWLITSLFHGLYYPVYGAATCIGLLPFAILQIKSQGNFIKNNLFTTKFITWVICFVVILLSTPLLLGLYRHVKAMAVQTIWADGMTRFGQFVVPAKFITSLGFFHGILLSLYYALTWVLPALFVWIPFMLSLVMAKLRIINRKLVSENWQIFCAFSSLVIMLLIAYTFTFVRLDFYNLVARGIGPLLAASVLLIVLTYQYTKDKKIRCFVMAMYVLFSLLIPAEQVVKNIGKSIKDGQSITISKLMPYYVVPDNFIRVSNTKNRIGTGFIDKEIYKSICLVESSLSKEDKEFSYFAYPGGLGYFPGSFGYFYLCNLKGDSVLESYTVRSYEATTETIENLRRNKTIIGSNIHPFENYYLYYWLLTSGEYVALEHSGWIWDNMKNSKKLVPLQLDVPKQALVWSNKSYYFMPNKGKYSREYILRQNKKFLSVEDLDIGKNASSLGLSITSLMPIFTDVSNIYDKYIEQEKDINIKFKKAIYGNDLDFMYLEFANINNNFEYVLYTSDYEYIIKQHNAFDKYFMRKRYNPSVRVYISWEDEDKNKHGIYCEMCEGKLLIPLGAGSRWLLQKHDNISIRVFKDNREIAVPNISDLRFLKLREVS